MSKTIVPEWKRLARQLESLVRGAWDDIMRHEDWLSRLDKRVEKLENRSKTSIKTHEKDNWPEC